MAFGGAECLMSRWKQLEDIERRLPDMSAEELRAGVEFWRKHILALSGPALKLGRKFLCRLERALDLKARAAAE